MFGYVFIGYKGIHLFLNKNLFLKNIAFFYATKKNSCV